MKNLLGRLFNTLSYRVEKNIKESLYENDVFLSTRWNVFEKNVVSWSTRYNKYILLMGILAALLIANLFQWQVWIKPYVVQYLPNWKELLGWQGTFLSGQLTIVGVIYPLVVGLISILFKNKSAKRVIFPIYQKYSGFMFAGLSGLALSGFIVAGYILRAAIDEQIYVAICLTSALWLFFNLLLTAWFFVQTFRMLDENSLEEILFRFSIHEVGEVDVRRRIKHILLEDVVHHKLIINPDEHVMEVLAYNYSRDEYQQVTRKVKRAEEVKDVKFRLVNIAIWIQLCILRVKKIQGGKLVINPHYASSSSDLMIICQYDGFAINPIVQGLLKLAFTFEKESPQVGLSTVLNSFVGPANDSLRDGDTREFSDAVDKLALWHAELAHALSFKNDNGRLDNWLLLPVSAFWSQTYLNELLVEYYRLAREAVERIPESSRFYTKMLYLYQHIFSSQDTLTKKEVKSLIKASYHMWYLLVEWRSYSSESSDLRIANKYEDILYDFVGAWEEWLMYIEPNRKQIRDLDKVYPAFITHLEFTASTAISALRFNNFEAAGWGVDMLNNWLGKLSIGDYWNAEYHWRSVLINHRFFSLDPGDDVWQSILKGQEYEEDTAFNLSLKNAHLDLRIITACYMLLKPGDEQPHLLKKYIKALLSGSRIHPAGDSGHSGYNISNAGSLLGAYIRHRDYCHYSKGTTYGAWLSSILESFGRIYEERRVSGRIYTGWGANDPRSMNRAYVEIAISMSDKQWSLPNSWEEALSCDFFKHTHREGIASDLREWIKIANEDRDYILVDPDNLETFKANFIASVEAIIQKIDKAQKKALTDAPIDHDRLKSLGVAISSIFRDKGILKFPLVLFEHLDRDADLDDNFIFILNLVDYTKERVALGLDTNRSVDEDKWMADYIRKSIKRNILIELIKYQQAALYKYTDTDSILSDIRSLSESMACPVLFVGSQQLSSVLHKSLYDSEAANRHDISRQDGFDKEYICHIGRCEVYALRFSDVDFCLLTTKELFDTVSFRKLTEEQYVDVDFELNEGSETVGKLIFKYWMKVDLAENIDCFKLELTEEGALVE
ncbi:MAG: hypothetical protein D3919_09840 [Candidatus Electrothrix sp. AW5]|nr:hypothetical protein [Candidatus Electrothrix gigas]